VSYLAHANLKLLQPTKMLQEHITVVIMMTEMKVLNTEICVHSAMSKPILAAL